MGKWSYLKEELPKWEAPQDQKPWWEKVQKRKEELELTQAEAGKLLLDLKRQKREKEAAVSELNIEIAAAEQFLIDFFEKSGTTSFRLDDGSLISHGSDVFHSVEDKEALYEWIDAEGLNELKSIHFKTLEGIVKKRLEMGEEEPPGIKLFFKEKINVRSSK